jgi:aryl-alcohol dehydrogenase-like predicted oxidoreductase
VPLAQDAGLSMTELALAWVLHNPNISAAIVGGSKPEQLKQNAQASGVKLDDDLLVQIDEVLEPLIERDPSRIDAFEKRP